MTQNPQISDLSWRIPSESFTELKVGKVSDLTWNIEDTSTARIGSAHFELVTTLREDIQEWMLSNGIRYQIDIADSTLVFFDRDSFLLFKLTWVGS